MTDLSQFTEEQLEKELERRKIKRPVLNSNPNFSQVIRLTEDLINDVLSGEYHEDNDYKQYIYEEVMTALYGSTLWDFFNKNT